VFIAALFCEVRGLEPLGKYFLVRFIQRFGIAEPVDLGVKVLAKQFGLADSQVSAALAALVSNGVMAFSSNIEGRGRPKRYYRLQATFVSKLNKVSPLPVTLYEGAISCLLRHEDKKAPQASARVEKTNFAKARLANLRAERQPGRLSVVNRLLLSILLCRADRFGVVSDLGFATLGKLTGLSKEHLKHRVGRLIDQGLIRAYVPGATSSVFVRKMKSIYYLTLDHPELGGKGDITSVFAYIPGRGISPDHVRHASEIRQEVNRLKRDPGQFEGLPYKQFLRFFEGQPSSSFRLLQVMLEKYAAEFLSRHWSDLAQSRIPFNKVINGRVEEWRELIRKDFRPAKALGINVSHLEITGPDQQKILEDELCYWAFQLAGRIKELFSQAPAIPFETMDFVIIPRPFESGYYPLVLLALPRATSGWRKCLIVEQSAEGDVHAQRFASEADIPLEDRYRYGFLIRPRSEATVA